MSESTRLPAWPAILSTFFRQNRAELLATIEYQRLENQLLRSRLPGRLVFTPAERGLLTTAALACGTWMNKAVTIVKPETILKWNARLKRLKWTYPVPVASAARRPSTHRRLIALILRFAGENRWGYARIGGELRQLGLTASKTYIKKVLRRHGFPIEGNRQDFAWKDFIAAHLKTMFACDFFTEEVWTWRGLVRYYTLFFINLFSRQVIVAGSTTHPDGLWIAQQARNFCMEFAELPNRPRFLIHDRDGAFSKQFDCILKSAGLEVIRLPPHAPDMNAHAERWIRSLRTECLDRMIFFGPDHLRHVVGQYARHYNESRPHQGIGNKTPWQKWRRRGPPRAAPDCSVGIRHRETIPGLLASYHWADGTGKRAA